jgi:hypothetical protein
MSRRVRIGPRANGDVGFFIGTPGADAAAAPDGTLVLNVSSKVSQLILMGRATSSTVVPLGLGRSPFVFITSQFNWSSVTGHTLGPGPFRPSGDGLIGMARSTCTINGNGSSMTLSIGLPTLYQVYNQAFT